MFTESIFLVAHTKNTNFSGLVFDLKLTAIKNHTHAYSGEGKMAEILLPLLKKVAGILKNIQPSWNILNNYQLILSGDYTNYVVKECDSAGLGLAIGLYNIARKINQSCCANGILGTGMIRLDGSVTSVSGISLKKEASLKTPNFKKLLDNTDINHLSKLHSVLKDYHTSC